MHEREQVERDKAKQFLRNILANGDVPARQIAAEATKRKIAKRTLKRAKKDLGIPSRRVGFGQGSYSAWQLPGTAFFSNSHTGPMDELTACVIAALEEQPTGLKLVAIVLAVVKAGYKTGDKNLTQAVYDRLTKLLKQGAVAKDADSNRYRLTQAHGEGESQP
jgi:hypothetical protein